jgi:hypothetical protein
MEYGQPKEPRASYRWRIALVSYFTGVRRSRAKKIPPGNDAPAGEARVPAGAGSKLRRGRRETGPTSSVGSARPAPHLPDGRDAPQTRQDGGTVSLLSQPAPLRQAQKPRRAVETRRGKRGCGTHYQCAEPRPGRSSAGWPISAARRAESGRSRQGLGDSRGGAVWTSQPCTSGS